VLTLTLSACPAERSNRKCHAERSASAVKHPQLDSSLSLGMTKTGMLGMPTRDMHGITLSARPAERSTAQPHPVMLSKAKHPQLDSSLSLGMTKYSALWIDCKSEFVTFSLA
jgi:hypothetical protein